MDAKGRSNDKEAGAANGEDAEPGVDEEEEPSFPVDMKITISKPGKGALQIIASAHDGTIMGENITFFQDAEQALAKTAEEERKAGNVYLGPEFGHLEEDLQMLIETYLDERGINTALALFLPDYIEYKEQREYCRWLESKLTFISSCVIGMY
jgi:complement component 1 Q subcomponent-binding protein